jgi:hypothetical protein
MTGRMFGFASVLTTVLSIIIGVPVVIVALVATAYLNDWMKRGRS